ncbi:MAG TPA: SHOCT domain-containing protein [Nitrosopumilaceae archaeon]|jgi:polyhydroxyalkanoate synthesis regulator phasin|nr:SHOCT domain-containing protein [Nitrosopumilaceae archaeon]
METKKKKGFIEKFLKRADRAIDEGIKKADEILADAVEFGGMAAGQAKKTSFELRRKAEKEGESLKKKGMSKLNEGFLATKGATSSVEQNLNTLEKLGKLKKSGVITEKEFQEKKKKILTRI